jgi:uncharacterized membrane protein SirB2
VIEFYPQIRWVHIAAVLTSGALFSLRGLGVLVGAHWPMMGLLRYLSYSIDTVLLTAALMLATMLPPTVFANHWLTAKLALLVLYVALGSYALKRGRTTRIRAACFAMALLTYVCMFGIARKHDPWGWFA